MAETIRISPAMMQERAQAFTREGEAFNDVINRMRNLVNQLQEEWEGDASASFNARYNELEPGFNNAKELIDDIARALNKAAEIIQDADARVSSAFSG